MKFHFTAIDEGGRVVRGVLRADDEAGARDALLSENVFAKQLQRADEEEKVTWAPRGRIKARMANAATWNKQKEAADAKPVAAAFRTVVLAGHDVQGAGEAGLSEDGAFVFVPDGKDAESLRLGPEDLEIVSLVGFPMRVLRLTLVSGRMVELKAGFFVASGAARQIVRHFKKELGKGKK